MSTRSQLEQRRLSAGQQPLTLMQPLLAD